MSADILARMRALALTLALILSATAAQAAGWDAVAGPTEEPAVAIGSPAAGCVAGAVALPPDGEGYQVLRLARHRNFGHPATVDFVARLAAAAQAEGLAPLLVGDMAQPRGGPMPFGHGSHQSGLDVDIWFRLPKAPLSAAEREQPVPVSMVKGERVDAAAWSPAQMRLLELAARAPAVDRIFVNPAIKRAVCRAAGDRSWVGKLRPWWGHDEHFHVRLACPPGSEGCESQKPVPDGDGCGAELDSWFAKGGTAVPVEKPHRQARTLPLACLSMLKR